MQYRLTYDFGGYVTVSWTGGFQSGVRFTPTVAGDVNGDGGFFNDRAFVFAPTGATDPTVAASMQSLLASGPAEARSCLARQLGGIAGRNSCTGPWTASPGNLSITLRTTKVWMPPRTAFTLGIQNPLVAADLLLHGSNRLHGWGETPAPDPTLLYVRGFDQTTQRYKYEVNPRFGSTSLAQNVSRRPVIVTAGFTLDVGPTRDWQSMRMALDRGRTKPGTKMTEAQLRSLSSALGVTNPMAAMLRSRDALRLTRKQSDSLSSLSRAFQIKIDSLWLPVAEYYNGLPTDFDHGIAHTRFVEAREAAVDRLLIIAPHLKGLLTAQQKRKLPAYLSSYLETRYLDLLRTGLISSGLPFEMMMMSMQ
jgi:hypothetical protein